MNLPYQFIGDCLIRAVREVHRDSLSGRGKWLAHNYGATSLENVPKKLPFRAKEP